MGRDTSDKFNQMVAARLRLVQQLGHLAGSLNITGLVWKKCIKKKFFCAITLLLKFVLLAYSFRIFRLAHFYFIFSQ